MTILPFGSLPVRHLDEVFAVVPDGSGVRFYLADLVKARDLIQGNVSFEKAIPNFGGASEVRQAYLEGAEAVTQIDNSLNAIVVQLSGVLDCEPGAILRMPVLIKPATSGSSGTYLPNAMNLQIVGGKVAVPNPFCGPIRTQILTELGGVPLFTNPFLDSWGPHLRRGNIHCTTLPFMRVIPENIP